MSGSSIRGEQSWRQLVAPLCLLSTAQLPKEQNCEFVETSVRLKNSNFGISVEEKHK